MHTEEDIQWMRLAIDESSKGRYIAPPNPAVGCVIVKDGVEIARGFTHAPGSSHAEIDAMNNAYAGGVTVEGATVYVTLEPCSHYGRTPPCALRLIKEKVARVVAAMTDPNPLVAGKGLAMLTDAGIEVECGVCADEAFEANIGFFTRMLRSTPWVRMKVAASLDGRTALSNGQSQWITGESARKAGRLLRARAQGLLTGIGTVLADDPQMTVRVKPCDFSSDELPVGVLLPEDGAFPDPVKYVVDAQAQTPVTAKILQGEPCIVFAGEDADAARVEALRRAGAEVRLLPLTEGKLDLASVLVSIGKDSINELHVEAGAGLNGALLSAGLVDEIVCYSAPCLMGEGMAIAAMPQFQSMNDVPRWRYKHVRQVGDDLELVLRKRS